MRAITVSVLLILTACASSGETREQRLARIQDHVEACWPNPEMAPISDEAAEIVKACAKLREERYQLANQGITGTSNPEVLRSYYDTPASRSATIYCVGC